MRPHALAAALLLTASLTACGGSGKPPLTRLADCLNAHGFLVAPQNGALLGTSPEGVGVTIRLYPTEAAARNAATKTGATQAGTAVAIDAGNPSDARVSAASMNVIRSCAPDG